MASFVVKASPQPDDARRLAFDEKTMWRGKTIRPGDEVFVFAAEHHGGRGLVARGVVTEAVRGEGIRVGIAVEVTGAAVRPLGRADLRPFRGSVDAGPEAEIDHKLIARRPTRSPASPTRPRPSCAGSSEPPSRTARVRSARAQPARETGVPTPADRSDN